MAILACWPGARRFWADPRGPVLTRVQGVGLEWGRLVWSWLVCDLLRSDTFMVLCLDRLQSGLGHHRLVHGALVNEGISPQDKVPLGNQSPGSASREDSWQAVWVGTALRALQSWSQADRRL